MTSSLCSVMSSPSATATAAMGLKSTAHGMPLRVEASRRTERLGAGAHGPPMTSPGRYGKVTAWSICPPSGRAAAVAAHVAVAPVGIPRMELPGPVTLIPTRVVIAKMDRLIPEQISLLRFHPRLFCASHGRLVILMETARDGRIAIGHAV